MNNELLATDVVALAAVVALYLTAWQMRSARLDRRVDYYRKLTPFLSFETTEVMDPTYDSIHAKPGEHVPTSPAIKVYADGGGYAFNVEGHIDQTGATAAARLVGQNVIRYLRAEQDPRRSAPTISFGPHAVAGFRGTLEVRFVDLFGIKHRAHQSVRFVAPHDVMETTDEIHWVCGSDYHVHVIRP